MRKMLGITIIALGLIITGCTNNQNPNCYDNQEIDDGVCVDIHQDPLCQQRFTQLENPLMQDNSEMNTLEEIEELAVEFIKKINNAYAPEKILSEDFFYFNELMESNETNSFKKDDLYEYKYFEDLKKIGMVDDANWAITRLDTIKTDLTYIAQEGFSEFSDYNSKMHKNIYINENYLYSETNIYVGNDEESYLEESRRFRIYIDDCGNYAYDYYFIKMTDERVTSVYSKFDINEGHMSVNSTYVPNGFQDRLGFIDVQIITSNYIEETFKETTYNIDYRTDGITLSYIYLSPSHESVIDASNENGTSYWNFHDYYGGNYNLSLLREYGDGLVYNPLYVDRWDQVVDNIVYYGNFELNKNYEIKNSLYNFTGHHCLSYGHPYYSGNLINEGNFYHAHGLGYSKTNYLTTINRENQAQALFNSLFYLNDNTIVFDGNTYNKDNIYIELHSFYLNEELYSLHTQYYNKFNELYSK